MNPARVRTCPFLRKRRSAECPRYKRRGVCRAEARRYVCGRPISIYRAPMGVGTHEGTGQTLPLKRNSGRRRHVALTTVGKRRWAGVCEAREEAVASDPSFSYRDRRRESKRTPIRFFLNEGLLPRALAVCRAARETQSDIKVGFGVPHLTQLIPTFFRFETPAEVQGELASLCSLQRFQFGVLQAH